jgi:hypothetical protein
MDEKLKEAFASLIQDKSKREELAQVIVEWVQPNHIATDFIGRILNTRSLKPGDSLVKKLRKGMRVLSHVPGSTTLKSELTVSERMNYVLDTAIISVQANRWELDSGELGTVESIRSEMMLKLRDFYQNKLLTALGSVWTAGNTPSNYTSVGGNITAAALKSAIDYINKTTPGAKAIFGSRAALTPITTFTNWWGTPGASGAASQSRTDEVMNTGWMGNYYGVPIVTVEQVYDNPMDHNTLVPTDKILVIGQNVGEFITYGDVGSQQWENMTTVPSYWNLDIWQQFGFLIDNAEGIYVLGNIS